MSARLVHVEVRCKRWMCQPEAVLKLVGWAASSVWRVTKTPFEATLILRDGWAARSVGGWAAVGWRQWRMVHVSWRVLHSLFHCVGTYGSCGRMTHTAMCWAQALAVGY
ncbi:MAG: hypothetical protein ACKERG_03765 [Candidatus Hodgkinia cicadicola]